MSSIRILLLLFWTLVCHSISPEYDLRTLNIDRVDLSQPGLNYTTWATSDMEKMPIKLPVKMNIYGMIIDKLDVYTNGFIALQQTGVDESIATRNYPNPESNPLSSQVGNFLSVLSLPIYGGKNGLVEVIVRELDKAPRLSNQETLHLKRNVEIINQVWGSDLTEKNHFKPNLMVTVIWRNVSSSDVDVDQNKRNTFSIVLLSDSKKSFVENQYNEITWIPVKYNLLIVAGLYGKEIGFQLPLSGLNYEASSWNGESNIAQAGQWLLPLYESKYTIEENQVQLIREVSDKVWSTFGEKPCGKIMCDSSADCIDPARDYCVCKDGYEGDGIICSQKFSTSTTTTENVGLASSSGCSSKKCKNINSKCSLLRNEEVCQCDLDRSFGGNDICFKIDSTDPIKLNLEGKILLSMGDYENATYLKTSVIYDEKTNSWTDRINLVDIPISEIKTMKFFSPVFQIINMVIKPPKITSVEQNTANLFTLFNGFSKPTNFHFKIHAETFGRMEMEITLENSTLINKIIHVDINAKIFNTSRLAKTIEPFQFEDEETEEEKMIKFSLDESNEKLLLIKRVFHFKSLQSSKIRRILIEGTVESENGFDTKGFKNFIEQNSNEELIFENFSVLKVNEACIDEQCNLSLGSSEEEQPSIVTEETTEIMATEYPYTSTFGPSICSNSQCYKNNAECYQLNNIEQCVCRESYFGGANSCFSGELDRSILLDGTGRVSIMLSGAETNGQLNFNIIIDSGKKETRSHSSIQNVNVNDEPTIRLLNPILHTINAILATPDRKCRNGEASFERIYNIFSLFDAFNDSVTFNFDIKMDRYGSVMAELIVIKRFFLEGEYQYDISGTIRRGRDFQRVAKLYEEVLGPSLSTGNAHYSSYKISNNLVVFDTTSVTFTDTNKSENITVSWSGTVQHTNGKLLPIMNLAQNDYKDNSLYLKYAAKSYCESQCDGNCELLCQDQVTLLKKNPSPCDCEVCPNANEKCYEDGSKFHCDCKEGYRRDSQNICSVKSTVGEKCGVLTCHVDAKCIDFVSNTCQCSPGYKGDGITSCTIDPCSRCRSNEVCLRDQCVIPPERVYCQDKLCATFAECVNGNKCQCPYDLFGDGINTCSDQPEQTLGDLCYGFLCGENAICDETSKNCICPTGFFGYPWERCEPNHFYSSIEDTNEGRTTRRYDQDAFTDEFVYKSEGDQVEIDHCKDRRCGTNASCDPTIGVCICNPGYEGYPWDGCRLAEANDGIPLRNCFGSTCGGNARCDSASAQCKCLSGYSGDPYAFCTIITTFSSCGGYQCVANAKCIDDYCICEKGFTGNGFSECLRQTNLCENARCGVNAICEESTGRCVCSSGYEGDPNSVCYANECNGHRCAENAECISNFCTCKRGWLGDGYSECRPESLVYQHNQLLTQQTYLCGGHTCGKNAVCISDRCSCPEGYDGYGYDECKPKPKGEKCGDHFCALNAHCRDNYCYCNDGFDGFGYEECKLSDKKPCDNVRCGYNAYCQENTGTCHCKAGFEGDPTLDCVGITPDNCYGHKCGRNAICDNSIRQCSCPKGYEGYAYESCEVARQVSSNDNCYGRRCGHNARCDESYQRCTCMNGYEGDPEYQCTSINTNYQPSTTCNGRSCGLNARCDPYENTCKCDPGYSGDPFSQCQEQEHGVQCGVHRCALNAICDNDYCVCQPGHVGFGYEECKPDTNGCNGRICHTNAECSNNNCVCKHGFYGDGERYCEPDSSCDGETCHPDAICSDNVCQCKSGYIGDGFDCQKDNSGSSNLCSGRQCDQNAYCDGRNCICNPGYSGNGEYCSSSLYEQQCQGRVCDPNASCQYNGCQCNPGFSGDGTYCIPANEDSTELVLSENIEVKTQLCGEYQCPEFAECINDKCVCTFGYYGDGSYHCFKSSNSCSMPCGQNAQCVNGVCQCYPGYSGDGYIGCNANQGNVKIERSDAEILLPSSQTSLSLICWVKGSSQVRGPVWSPVTARSQENILQFQDSTRVELIVNNIKPSEDATTYTCSANGMRDSVKVRFADETGISIPLLVSSDNGISKVNHTGESTTTAKIWKLANGMKYKPVSLAFNSMTENAFFTDDDYKKIMFANTNKKITTSELIETPMPIREIAVDSASSNVYALTFNNSVFVVSESKPGIKYDLEGVAEKFKDTIDAELVNIALNPEQGLMYVSVKSLKENSTIHVFKMNGEYVKKLIDLDGQPKSLSYGKVTLYNNDYGRLCTLQRMMLMTNDALKMRLQCYKLTSNGEGYDSDSNSRDFYQADLPAGGLLQMNNMIIWTVSNSRSYHTLAPSQKYLVKRVCCSVRFQSIVDARKNDKVKSACKGDTSCSTVCLPTSPTKKECA